MNTAILLIIAVALLAYANGANDNFKPVATLYGSSTLGYRSSLWVATIAQLLGSLASVLLAGAVLRIFGGKGMVPDSVVAGPVFLMAVGGGAAATVLLATRFGLPISTTHALIGGLCGAGRALSPAEFVWGALGPQFVVPLLVSPLLAVLGAGTVYPFLSSVRRRLGIDAETCLCVGEGIEPVGATLEGAAIASQSTLTLEIADTRQCAQQYVGSFCGITAQRLVDAAHLFSGSALGFARGLNDTPKIMALLVAATWTGLNPRAALGCLAVIMALGGLIHSARIARTMGERITTMNTGQGLLANVMASGLVIGASLLGMGVSTTHVSNGAIFGIGFWTGRSDWKVVTEIVLAWVITLPIAAIAAYAIATVAS